MTTVLQRLSAQQAHRVISAVPLRFRKPTEGEAVLFWTHYRLQPAATTRGNAVTGVFRDGSFWAGPDHWSLTEVSHWASAVDTDKI